MSAAANNEATKKKASSAKPKTFEEIFGGFQKLRNEQRALTQKIIEMEEEQQEHKLVIATLKKMEDGRKCFRMNGGVLSEQTVGQVLPTLLNHEQQLSELIKKLNERLVAKGTEVNAYKELHNIKIRGVDDPSESAVDNEKKPASTGGVLVS